VVTTLIMSAHVIILQSICAYLSGEDLAFGGGVHKPPPGELRARPAHRPAARREPYANEPLAAATCLHGTVTLGHLRPRLS